MNSRDIVYRTYEGHGLQLNPLDHSLAARAVFSGALEWSAGGAALPPSRTLAVDESGQDDAVYGFPTGILRDADLNALGGVRLPEVAIGTARFIAANFAIDAIPPLGLLGLIGGMVDLTCAPRAGESEPRFATHGEYVKAYNRQANALLREGFLLATDAERIKEAAGSSAVGSPGSCG